MCSFIMSFNDPLSVTTSSTKTLVGTDANDTLTTAEECNEKTSETSPLEEVEGKTPVPPSIEDTQSTVETNLEEQNMHHINANSCIRSWRSNS
ncbi:hypothetical protein GDO81_004617 [Engystomops pustulosus]|uniref:Uncharacterized protein n=1 Tax=Engystomops pustulosus TaxID=76066 RepID=A0AAV7A207_ENGPU|nr:hypothetical protein GDO81_004617 [Engystomops pustulosus]KAG8552638.1 hypothetical protein GDO81_004617 [Engystomops pustulosus]